MLRFSLKGSRAALRGGPQPLDRISRSLGGLSAGLIKRLDPRILWCMLPAQEIAHFFGYTAACHLSCRLKSDRVLVGFRKDGNLGAALAS